MPQGQTHFMLRVKKYKLQIFDFFLLFIKSVCVCLWVCEVWSVQVIEDSVSATVSGNVIKFLCGLRHKAK